MTEPRDKTAKRKRTHDLSERVKELNCLYGISNLVHRPDISLEEILQETVDLIPPGWQYPEVTCARITLEGQEFRTENFRETVCRQTSDIIVNGERSGAVEVCYLEERRESDEGCFLPEKGDLINAIAERLGRVIERKQAEQALRESEEQLRNVLDVSRDLIYRLNLQTRTYDYVSPSSLRLVGFAPQEIVAMGVEGVIERFHSEDRERFRTHPGRLPDDTVEGREAPTIEYRWQCRDGEYRWLSDNRAFVLDEGGRAVALVGTVRDVTEDKQAEEALRESEARYKALFAGAPEGMLVADLETKQFRHANPAMCRMFGYTEEEFLRLGVADIHPKESVSYVLAEFEAQARGKKLLSADLPCQRKDNSLFYANVNTTMVVLDGRRCNVGFFTDITERKKAEEALRESEERFRNVLKVSRDLIYRLNLQTGEYDYATPSLLELYGFTGEELAALGRKRTDQRVHPRDRERVRLNRENLLDQTAADAVSPPVDYRFKCKDGTYRWFSANQAVARDEGGRPTAVVSCVRDITEQRRSEEALRRRATELEDLNRQLARAHDELAKSQLHLAERSMLLQRVVEVQILPLSESFEAVAREVLGLLIHLIPADIFAFAILDEGEPLILAFAPARPSQKVGNEVRRRLLEAAELALGRTLPARTEIRFEPIDSEAVNVENIRSHVLLPLTSLDLDTPILAGMFSREDWAFRDDDIGLFSAVGVCIASFCVVRRNVEELRRATATLEQRNAELDAFTYSVSHDLKEPLRAIEAFSQFLLQDFSEQLDDEGRDYLARMNKASLHLKQLIDDLLRLSRASRQAVGEERVVPHRLIGEVVAGMRATIDAKAATVEVEEGMPDVAGNPPWVEQIFSNLIGNALKFNESECPSVKIGVRAIEGEMATFYVQDNGIGIDPQYHERIFGIFQRLHRREDYEGTGAGLAIVKQVVEALGGRVRVESEVGAGATFLFSLPLWTEVSASAQGEAA